ncbi:MAG: YbjQ family protein [Rhodothalassiaceae bacterium]
MAILHKNEGGVIVTNTEAVPGRTVARHLGLVQGSTVRAKHVGRDILAGFKGIVGGELRSYTELMTEAREEALARLVQEAETLGADAVLNVRLTTAAVTGGAAEILAYGTAVALDPL